MRNNWFTEALEELAKPFPVEKHSFKPLAYTNSGAWVAYYVDLRHMLERVQEVLGERISLFCELQSERYYVKAKLLIHDPESSTVVTYEDVGYAPEEAPEGYKAAVTDAYRRVLTHLGVCRYLYLLPRIHIATEEQKGKGGSGFPIWKYAPLKALQEAMKSHEPVLFFGDRGNTEEKADSETTKRKPNKNEALWREYLEVGEDDDGLVESFRNLFGLQSMSDKQVAAYMRLTNPNEVVDDLVEISREGGDISAVIKSTLDEKLGKR